MRLRPHATTRTLGKAARVSCEEIVGTGEKEQAIMIMRGLGACQLAYIEGRRGFEPFVDEKDYSVATSGHHLASERSSPRGGIAGCEEDPWAGAEAPAPSWIGATRSDPDVGQEGMLSSPSEGRAEAWIDDTSIDLASSVDCDVDSASLADAHGDPPRIDDTGAHRTERLCCSGWELQQQRRLRQL